MAKPKEEKVVKQPTKEELLAEITKRQEEVKQATADIKKILDDKGLTMKVAQVIQIVDK